jgi:hypothetical protein
VATRSNLRRAWLWTKTSSDRVYKEYCSRIYRAYSLVEHEALESLRDRLLGGIFMPARSTKIYFPKPSGVQRPITLLGVEDQIVYQAYVNLVADRLYSRVRGRYHRTVFGNLYSGGLGNWFYVDWRRSYRFYTNAMRAAFAAGYKFTASFDLMSCYDSIDHQVIRYFLRSLRLDEEFSESLTNLLSYWTESSGNPRPLYHGHGIPQGPLPSGMLAEAVLRYFDETKRPRGVRYFRYVDDIRLFAKDESSLRLELVKLDILSKQVGLFPQGSKIDIHRVVDIEEEFKSISNPPESVLSAQPLDQSAIRRRINELSPRLHVANSTRFKWVLSSCQPEARLTRRLMRVVQYQPHLYEPIFRHIAKTPRLSIQVTSEALTLLETNDLYNAVTASLIRSIRANLHSSGQKRLEAYCRKRLHGTLRSDDPELRAAAASVLLKGGVATWAQTEFNVRWTKNWWVRTELIHDVQQSVVGHPSYAHLVNALLRDDFADVAVVAAELAMTEKVPLATPLNTIHPLAQQALRNGGRIGRVTNRACPMRGMMVDVLGSAVSSIYWRRILPAKTYRLLLSRVAVWRGYSTSDPTAWVILSDTINDILLNELFAHDLALGSYAMGSIGSVIHSPTSAFARRYPQLQRAVKKLHDVRLQADLVHPVTRQTSKPTRRITFREKRRLEPLLIAGYRQLWNSW